MTLPNPREHTSRKAYQALLVEAYRHEMNRNYREAAECKERAETIKREFLSKSGVRAMSGRDKWR